MDRNSIDWHGSMPAATTAFNDDGSMDEAGIAASLERLLADGSTGVVVGGCTGEFWALSHDERCRLYDIAAEAVGGRGTLIVGTGAVTVDETVALTRHAEAAGCDGALILPPYFVKLSDDEIVAHFDDVAAATGLPILLYNIPGNAVNALTPALASRLADIDHVVGVKESSGDWNNFYGTFLAVHERIRVFCGPSSIFGVPALQLGADGTIDCFPNVWAAGGQPMNVAATTGDVAGAAALQATGRALTDLFTSGGRTLYPSTKAAMDILGLPGGGTPRRPLRPLAAQQRADLEAGLAALGLL
jgi:dihydrodipicolinate synthase/N-acetylneuraminate lyase